MSCYSNFESGLKVNRVPKGSHVLVRSQTSMGILCMIHVQSHLIGLVLYKPCWFDVRWSNKSNRRSKVLVQPTPEAWFILVLGDSDPTIKIDQVDSEEHWLSFPEVVCEIICALRSCRGFLQIIDLHAFKVSCSFKDRELCLWTALLLQ